MIKSSHVDQPLGSVLHGEVGLVPDHMIHKVEAALGEAAEQHVLVHGGLVPRQKEAIVTLPVMQKKLFNSNERKYVWRTN